jgi:hypothetical protein
LAEEPTNERQSWQSNIENTGKSAASLKITLSEKEKDVIRISRNNSVRHAPAVPNIKDDTAAVKLDPIQSTANLIADEVQAEVAPQATEVQPSATVDGPVAVDVLQLEVKSEPAVDGNTELSLALVETAAKPATQYVETASTEAAQRTLATAEESSVASATLSKSNNALFTPAQNGVKSIHKKANISSASLAKSNNALSDISPVITTAVESGIYSFNISCIVAYRQEKQTRFSQI